MYFFAVAARNNINIIILLIWTIDSMDLKIRSVSIMRWRHRTMLLSYPDNTNKSPLWNWKFLLEHCIFKYNSYFSVHCLDTSDFLFMNYGIPNRCDITFLHWWHAEFVPFSKENGRTDFDNLFLSLLYKALRMFLVIFYFSPAPGCKMSDVPKLLFSSLFTKKRSNEFWCTS